MADVAAALKDWSPTDSSNSPSGSTSIATGLDDNLRAIQGGAVRGLSHKGADIASATTTDLGAIEGLMHDITGTTTITGFGTVRAGIWKIVKFEGALTLTHNATSLILPGGANVTTADGDIGIFMSEGSGNWRCVTFFKASNQPIGTGQIKFPATQNASSDVNTLDDYEEGSWTPTLAGSSTAGTQTYTTQVGRYVKVGNMVYAQCKIIINAKDGATAGDLRITGLPFTAETVTGMQAAFSAGVGFVQINTGGNLYSPIFYVESNTAYITLAEQSIDIATAIAALTAADFAAGSSFIVAGHYRAA